MILFLFALDEHIINVYLHILPNLFVEHLVYQSLIRGLCVLQTKGHNPVTIEPLASDERSLCPAVESTS